MHRKYVLILFIFSLLFFNGCTFLSNNVSNNLINNESVISHSSINTLSNIAHCETLNKGKISKGVLPERLKTVRIGYDKDASFQTVEFENVNLFSHTAGAELCDATIIFDAKLNAAKLDKNFNFIDYLVIPSNYENVSNSMPQSDFDSVEIKLTEVENPSNYVVFQTVIRPDLNYVISARAGASNQAVEGLIYPNYTYVKDYGLQLTGSFVGAFNNYIWSSGFAFDNASNTTYAFPQASTNISTMIRDLDNSTHMIDGKNESIWQGFTSNEIEVSLTLKNIKPGATATIALLSYNGIVLNNDIIDNQAPIIEIEQYPEDIVGQVNKKFNIFKHVATDNIDGYQKVDDYKVYYQYKQSHQEEILIIDNYFIPTKSGDYTIVATKKDSSGNIGIKETLIKILNRLSPLKVVLNGELPNSCFVGSYINLPTAKIFGGTAEKHYSIIVLKNDKQIDIINNQLFIKEQGIYVVRYIADDYLHSPINYDYCINAKISVNPIVEFPVLPNIFILGQEYEIPKFSAKDYSSLNGELLQPRINYSFKAPDGNEKNSKLNIFKPDQIGIYTITIKVMNNLNDYFVEKNYEVEVREGKKVIDYIEFDNVTNINLIGDDVAYRYGKETGKVTFIKALPIDRFKFNFKIIDGIKNFETFDILLVDSQNASEQVTLKIKADKYTHAGEAELCGEKVILRNIFYENRPYNIFYNNGVLASSDGSIGKISKFDNGNEFNGFSSKLVYFTCRLSGITDNVDLMYNGICNHANFSQGAEDNSRPMIVLDNSISSDVTVGDRIIIPKAVGYDVFSGICQVKFVIKRNGKVVLDSTSGINEYIIPDFAKYEISFSSCDLNNNPVEISKNIDVIKFIKPNIEILEYFNKNVSKGQKINLPNAIAKDSNGTQLVMYAYVETPTKAVIDINDFELDRSFIFNEKGVYVIHYVTHDKNFIYNKVKFNVEVR